MTKTRLLDVVVGGHYGSEGKGAVAGALVDRFEYDHLIRVAGPNAGHTTYTNDGVAVALRCIPAAGVRSFNANLVIGPGSEVDLEVLRFEIDLLQSMDIPVTNRLYVHEQATILTEHHRAEEVLNGFGAAGSTHKGIGAARAGRAMRRAPIAADYRAVLEDLGARLYAELPDYNRAMIEGTQGYWLGLHAGLYPFCTSSDCRAIDFVAMAGTMNWRSASIYVLFRSYPIRIAGNSGDLNNEVSWDELSERTGGYIKPEFTTVTKKLRRVGEWDYSLLQPAIDANTLGPGSSVLPCLTFGDYVDPQIEGLIDSDGLPYSFIETLVDLMPGEQRFSYVGTGPVTGVWL